MGQQTLSLYLILKINAVAVKIKSVSKEKKKNEAKRQPEVSEATDCVKNDY